MYIYDISCQLVSRLSSVIAKYQVKTSHKEQDYFSPHICAGSIQHRYYLYFLTLQRKRVHDTENIAVLERLQKENESLLQDLPKEK